MQKMMLRWTGCGHDIEFPQSLCGGECCMCATRRLNPSRFMSRQASAAAADVKRSRIAEGQP